MDEAEGSLPSLGKRRSTDTALSGQTSAKRSRPGSLAEVGLPSLRKEKKRKEKKRKEKKRKEKKRKEKKRKEKTAPLGVNLMRSQVLYRPAQVPSFKYLTIRTSIPVSIHPSIWHLIQRVSCPIVKYKSVLSSSLCEVRLLTVGVADVNAATDRICLKHPSCSHSFMTMVPFPLWCQHCCLPLLSAPHDRGTSKT